MNDNLEFLDILNILSFVIGVMNYNENLTQGDKQDLMDELDKKISYLLESINNHLQIQDDKLDYIMEVLNEKDKKVS